MLDRMENNYARTGDDAVIAASSHRGAALRRTRAEYALWLLVAGVAVATVAVAVLTPSFLTGANIKGVLLASSLTGIVAVAMTPMTLSGNFVSLATQQTALGAAMLLVVLLNRGWPVIVAALAIIVLVVMVGILQAAFVVGHLNPVITTLAAGSIIYGVTVTLSHSNPQTVQKATLGWGNATVVGLPFDVLVMFAFTAIVTVFVHRTALGREIVLSGANRAAAEISGISHRAVTVTIFGIFSVGVAIVSILYVAAYSTVTQDSMGTLTFDAITALLVGGTAISGGIGSPWRSAVGAIFIAAVSNVLALHNLNPGDAQAFEGAIVIVAVVLLVLAERRRSAV